MLILQDINQAENKLKIFVEDMKGAKADLKVGLSLSSTQYKNFPCNDCKYNVFTLKCRYFIIFCLQKQHKLFINI